MWVFLGWIGSALAAMSGWVATYFGVKIAVQVSAFSLAVFLTIAFTSTLYAVIAGLVGFTSPGGWYAFGMSLIPTNLVGCLSAYLAAHVTAAAYEYQYGYSNRASNIVE